MRTLEVYIDAELLMTWTSSGSTTAFETIGLFSVPGKMVELRGVLSDDEWLSISEVCVWHMTNETILCMSITCHLKPLAHWEVQLVNSLYQGTLAAFVAGRAWCREVSAGLLMYRLSGRRVCSRRVGICHLVVRWNSNKSRSHAPRRQHPELPRYATLYCSLQPALNVRWRSSLTMEVNPLLKWSRPALSAR